MPQPRSMISMGAVVLVTCAGLLSSACRKEPASAPLYPGAADTGRDSELEIEDLARELELVILDNYLQLAVGNIETYADSIARDSDVMLVGIGPQDIFVGQNPSIKAVDRRPFKDRGRCMTGARALKECVKVLSKRLDIHLYADDSIGWLSDEISYRVPYGGRQATVTLRITAVFARDIDLWVLVAEHLSYALPKSEIMAFAEDGTLAMPKRFSTKFDPMKRTVKDLLTMATEDWLNQRKSKRIDHSMERGRLSTESRRELRRARKLIDDGSLLTLFPDPHGEYHDEHIYEAETLAQYFGEGSVVTIDDVRLSVSATGRVAWMTANLMVTTPSAKDGRPLRIGLRGTFLYARDQFGWNLLQSHISVPVTKSQLKLRVFGALPESFEGIPTNDGDEPPPLVDE